MVRVLRRGQNKPAYPGAPPGAPFVPVSQRGLRWVGRQLAATEEDDGSRAKLFSDFRWKWVAAGDFEWRHDVERATNQGLQQHLVNNMPGWTWEMAYLPKVINLHEQVYHALFDDDGDLSKVLFLVFFFSSFPSFVLFFGFSSFLLLFLLFFIFSLFASPFKVCDVCCARI